MRKLEAVELFSISDYYEIRPSSHYSFIDLNIAFYYQRINGKIAKSIWYIYEKFVDILILKIATLITIYN